VLKAGKKNLGKEREMARITNVHNWITTLLQFHPSPLPGMLVLEGPPGSGKTLLVQEWLTSLSTQKASPAITAHHISAKKQETPAQFARRLAQDARMGSLNTNHV
jgi:Cdc6-like AAA superfamily ATPase